MAGISNDHDACFLVSLMILCNIKIYHFAADPETSDSSDKLLGNVLRSGLGQPL